MVEAHENLADAGAAGWEGFTAVFTPPVEFAVASLTGQACRFTAKLSYLGKPFASDLLLIEALLADQSLAETRSACNAVFDARNRHTWPTKVTPQPHWGRIYQRALEGLDALDLPPTVTEAAQRVQAFVDRIDASRPAEA